jgi:hypothetical protein
MMSRWVFAVAVFPLLWLALWAVGLFGSLSLAQVTALGFVAVVAYLTQPLWIWRLAHSSDGWEERSRLVRETPAVLTPAAAVAAVTWAWLAMPSDAAASSVPIARAPGEEWRLWILVFPFLVVLFGWAFAMLRQERTPMTLGAALALPLSAPVLWLCLCQPVTV